MGAERGHGPGRLVEAHLLVEYKAAFGLDNADAIDAAVGLKDPVGERVKELNYLETVLATMGFSDQPIGVLVCASGRQMPA